MVVVVGNNNRKSSVEQANVSVEKRGWNNDVTTKVQEDWHLGRSDGCCVLLRSILIRRTSRMRSHLARLGGEADLQRVECVI